MLSGLSMKNEKKKLLAVNFTGKKWQQLFQQLLLDVAENLFSHDHFNLVFSRLSRNVD
jgi:hypothetical protein